MIATGTKCSYYKCTDDAVGSDPDGDPACDWHLQMYEPYTDELLVQRQQAAGEAAAGDEW